MTKFAKLDYCTYVLFSEADGKLYIGYTTDLHYSNPELWATRICATCRGELID
jgi:hypothetical protein